MKVFTVALAAGTPRELPIEGRFFMLIGTSAPLDVDLWDSGRSLDESGLQVQAGYKARPAGGFDKVILTSATAQTVKIGFSRGEGGYDPVSVTFVDQISADHIAGYGATAYLPVAAAATFNSNAILHNPTGSGRRIIVDAVWAWSAVANAQVQAWVHNASFGTLSTTWRNTKSGAALLGELRTTNADTTTRGQVLAYRYLGAANVAVKLHDGKGPIAVLEPGFNLHVRPVAVNVDVVGVFEGREIPI